MCPEAYSWQFDDNQSTYQCIDGDYQITFCPNGESFDDVEVEI